MKSVKSENYDLARTSYANSIGVANVSMDVPVSIEVQSADTSFKDAKKNIHLKKDDMVFFETIASDLREVNGPN